MFACALVLLVSVNSTDAQPAADTPQQQLQWRGVWEWSMDHRTEGGLIEIADTAEALGFNALMMRPPTNLVGFMRDQCRRRGIKLYLSTVFSGGDKNLHQVMTPAETERAKKGPAETFQGGGEPHSPDELFNRSLPCWNRPAVRERFRKMVTDLAALPADGLAFDGVGYQNYHRCHCPVCEAKLADFRKRNPGLSEGAASAICAEQAMVEFINDMAAVARAARPDIEITIHIWPCFRPHPCYGYRLDIDHVGETVAWFFDPHWPLEKVGALAAEVVGDQAKCRPPHLAAPFIGFYRRPIRHVRSAKRVQAEIDIIRAAGAEAIQFAELGHIARKPTVARVVAAAMTQGVAEAQAQ